MVGNRFVKLAHKFFTDKSFSYVLGTRTALIAEKNGTRPEDPFNFDYKIPNRLCKVDKDTKAMLPIGPIMALFDELSSFGFMAKDGNRRGGVSVYLSANVHQFPNANEDVVIETTIRKIGKSLGFCDIRMLSKSNPNICYATGYHIKFLPIGFVYNLLTNSYTLPWLVSILEDMNQNALQPHTIMGKIMSKIIKSRGKEMKMSEESEKLLKEDKVGGLYDHMKLELVSLGGIGQVVPLKVTADYTNVLGFLHGGACAIAIEESVYLSMNDSKPINSATSTNTDHTTATTDTTTMDAAATTAAPIYQQSQPWIRQMNVKYLSPLHGTIEIKPDIVRTVNPDNALAATSCVIPPTHGTQGTVVKRGPKHGGYPKSLCVQFECFY